MLRGKCRYCGASIPVRYLAIELLAAILPVLLHGRFGFAREFFLYVPLSYVLLVVSFVDLDKRIIPDRVTLPGIVVGLAAAPILGVVGIWDSLLGVLAAGGALYLIGILGELILKKESMGGGDVKLAAMLGAFLGWRLALAGLFVAFFVGAIAGIGVLVRGTKEWDSSLPFGPFIALGAVVALLWGDSVLAWYASFFG
jgi:leader peptidase (prepilin peptidase)/N-methyltransferase